MGTTLAKVPGSRFLRLAGLVLIGAQALAPAALAGTLDPAGPPAPTMKALDVVEPRIPISSIPITISTAGSYYLTKNLTMSGVFHGILVTAGPTTIDLNGFTLDGNLTGGFGINASSGVRLSVRNGSIIRWFRGLFAFQAHLEDLNIQSCTNNGADVSDGIISRCSFLSNGGIGISSFGITIIKDSRSSGNGGFGMSLFTRGLIEDCIVDANTGAAGIYLGFAGTVRHSNVIANTGAGIQIQDRVLIAENNIYQNGSDGIQALGLGESRIEGNSVCSNGGFGIKSTSGGNFITRNSARGNSLGNFSISGSGNVAPIEINTITNAASNVSY